MSIDRTKPWIVAAACKVDEMIFVGARHWDTVMRRQAQAANLHKQGWGEAEQGFIDQRGNFYDRKAAWDIAETNGQIREVTGTGGGGILFSEDLY